MTIINTRLVRDGNSVAIRLPKTVLTMSGLHGDVQMEVKQGEITLRSAHKPRTGWEEKIASVAENTAASNKPDKELKDWDITSNDGLN